VRVRNGAHQEPETPCWRSRCSLAWLSKNKDPGSSSKRVSGLTGRDLLSVSDLSSEELWQVLEMARTLKAERGSEKWRGALRGKSLAMLFMKPSTRTRVSFDLAMSELGGHTLVLSPAETQLSRGETVADTARVLSRYVSAIMARVTSHEFLTDLAQHANIPVINGLSDLEHPCQAISDMFTVWERFGRLKDVNIAYLGDGNNVANSLMLAASLMGANVAVASPKGLGPRQAVVDLARKFAVKSGSTVKLTADPMEAVGDADVVYTDVWVSMGDEEKAEEKKRMLSRFQVDGKVMRAASKGAIFMHCLPAHRGEEVTDEVIDGERSIVFQQAENRLHVQKAILLSIL